MNNHMRTTSLTLVQQHQITYLDNNQSLKIINTLKKMHPQLIIKISLFKSLEINSKSNINKNNKQNLITPFSKQLSQTCRNFKHSQIKLNSSKNKQKNRQNVKTQLYQPEQINYVKKCIVLGFIQAQAQEELLGKQQSDVKLIKKNSFQLQEQHNQQVVINEEKNNKTNQQLKKQKSIKNLETVCRFYGTQTFIQFPQQKNKDKHDKKSKQNLLQRNLDQQELLSQCDINQQLFLQSKTKDNNSSKHPKFNSIYSNSHQKSLQINQILHLTSNQDLYQGIFQYDQKNYHNSIQIFLPMFYQFLSQSIILSQIHSIKSFISQNLSFYQKRTLSNLTFYLGNCYFRIRQYKYAILFYQYQCTIEQDKQQKAQRYNNMGSCYIKINKQHMALKSYQKALKLYNVFAMIDKSNLLYNIANMYLNFGMYKQANQYFIQSIEERKAKSPEKQEMLCKTYFYLAISQRHQNKIQSSIGNLILAKQMAQTGKISRNLHQKVLYQMAYTYQLTKRYRKSLNYYQKIVQQICKNGQNRIQLGEIYQRVSYIFKRLKNKDKYLYFKKKSLQEYRGKFNSKQMG